MAIQKAINISVYTVTMSFLDSYLFFGYLTTQQTALYSCLVQGHLAPTMGGRSTPTSDTLSALLYPNKCSVQTWLSTVPSRPKPGLREPYRATVWSVAGRPGHRCYGGIAVSPVCVIRIHSLTQSLTRATDRTSWQSARRRRKITAPVPINQSFRPTIAATR